MTPPPSSPPSLSVDTAYADALLDRAAIRRRDPDFLAAALVAPGCRRLPVWRNRHPVSLAADGPRAVFWPAGEPLPAGSDPPVFLGLAPDGAPWFAADLSTLEAPPLLLPPPLPPHAEWCDLRAVGPLLPAGEAAALAQARGLLHWHRRHLYCGACGAPTVQAEGGHRRDCVNPDCALSHFPRTDPAVIMLVVDDAGRALLGHGPRMPAGMLTTLAGFVEPGETLEQAVAREVAEETGVRVGLPVYRGSQPWPFPGSLMVGFTAPALSTAITLDPAELVHAAWYERAAVRTFAEVGDGDDDGRPRLPRRDSIARQLITLWLDEA